MPAFRLQFGNGTTQPSIAGPGRTDASRLDVPALRVKGSRATDVRRRDVACLSVHLDAIAAWHSDLKLHPELRVSGARRLWRKHAGNFHSGGERLRLERVRIEEPLSGGTAGIGFDVHGVAHDWRGAGLELGDVDGPEIRRQPQRQTIFGAQYTGANNGGVLRTRVRGLGVFEGRRFFSFGRKHRRCEGRQEKKDGQDAGKRHRARDRKKPLMETYIHRRTRFLAV